MVCTQLIYIILASHTPFISPIQLAGGKLAEWSPVWARGPRPWPFLETTVTTHQLVLYYISRNALPICTQETITSIVEFIADLYRPNGSMSASTNVMVHFLRLSSFISVDNFPQHTNELLPQTRGNRTHFEILEPPMVTPLLEEVEVTVTARLTTFASTYSPARDVASSLYETPR